MAKDMRAAATNEATSNAGEATGGTAPSDSQTTPTAPVTAATPSWQALAFLPSRNTHCLTHTRRQRRWHRL